MRNVKNSAASNLNYMARNLNLVARSFCEMPCSENGVVCGAWIVPYVALLQAFWAYREAWLGLRVGKWAFV